MTQNNQTFVLTGSASYLGVNSIFTPLRIYEPSEVFSLIKTRSDQISEDCLEYANLMYLNSIIEKIGCNVITARSISYNGINLPTQGWMGRLLIEAEKDTREIVYFSDVYKGLIQFKFTHILDIGTLEAKLTPSNDLSETVTKKVSQELLTLMKEDELPPEIILHDWLERHFGIDDSTVLVFATGDFRKLENRPYFVISQEEEASYINKAIKTAYNLIGIRIDGIIDYGNGSTQIIPFNDCSHFSSSGLKSVMASITNKEPVKFSCALHEDCIFD